MNPLEITGLRKDFGAVAALRDITFAIAPGEVFGYLGPNGAGKTTTVRIILGLVHPSGGDVRVFGELPRAPATRERIGFLPGDLRLYGDMTARGALDFFAHFRPAAPPVLRAQLLDALTLDANTLDRRIKFLSHGTRQKIGLIVAMQHQPDLLLLDEPSNGLDPLVQRAFRTAIRDFGAGGGSVLLSSHALTEVEALCRRVAILREGRIVGTEIIDQVRGNLEDVFMSYYA